MALGNILPPGYRAYKAVQAQNEQGEMQDLQKAQVVQGMLAKLQAQKQEEAFRGDVAGLGGAPTQEQLAQVAARHTRDPKALLDIQQKSLDRKAAAEAKAVEMAMAQDVRMQEIERRRDADKQRATTDAEKRSADERYRNDQLALQRDRDMWNRYFAQQGIDIKKMMAERKGEEAAAKVGEAKKRVSTNLTALTGYYDELDKLGAMVDTKKSGAENLSARIRASGVGQMVGGAVGSPEQEYRDKVNQMRPLLLNEIRQATAQGVKGLDSNKELEFYLQAATDPTKGIQVNRAAIQVLEDAYGLSSATKADPVQVKKLKDSFAGQGGAPSAVREFATEAEAAAAGVEPGERVKINGVLGTWQ